MTNRLADERSPRTGLVARLLGCALLLGFAALSGGCGGSSRAISVIVPGAGQLVSIAVGPPAPTLAIGLTQQFTATGVYSDGSKQNITSLVTWKSGAVNVATIGGGGLATAVNLGATTIIAAYGSIVGTTTLTVSGAALTAIDITPAAPHIALGSQQQFVATGVYSDFTTRNLTTAVQWVSSSPGIATISTNGGLAAAGSAGTTTITATLGSVFGTTTLTVNPATLVSIAITPANSSLPAGTTETLTATGTFSDNSVQNLTATVTWTSSNPGIALLSLGAGGTEVVTGVTQGGVTVTASLNGISGSTTVTVTPATLVSIAVTPANPSTPNGLTQQFIATGTYTDGSTQFITTTAIWSSSATAVATISNAAGSEGLATTVTPGTTTITATATNAAGPVTGTTTLTVTPATLVSIAITPSNAVISIGSTQQYTAVGTFTDGTTQPLTTVVTWNSSAAAVASISNAAGTNGLATGSAIGTTQISAIDGAITSNSVPLTVAAAFCYSLDFDRADAVATGTGTLYQWAILADGSLAALTATPTAETGPNPYSITVDSTGQYVYVANYDASTGAGSTISQYTKIDGSLTHITPDIVTAAGANGVTAHPLQPFIYVASLDGNQINQYTIGPGGVLALTSTVTAATPTAGIDGPASIALNPAGTYAYAANFNGNSVSQFAVQANGSLVAIAAPVIAGSGADSISVDPSGRYVYVTNQFDNNVWQYTIQGDGSLMAMTPQPFVATATAPRNITVSTVGNNVYAYVANDDANPGDANSNSVNQYNVDPVTGALTLQDTVPGLPGANAIAIDPTGHYAYVTDRRGTPAISEFSISQTTGTLTALGNPNTIAAGSEPTGIITSR